MASKFLFGRGIGVLGVLSVGLAAYGAALRIAPLNPAYVADREARLSGLVAPGENYGYRPAPFDSSYLSRLGASDARAMPLSSTPLPATYDLRTLGRLTPVRNQGAYGTCWTFATFSSMESCILTQEGVACDFSENHLANLHGYSLGFDFGGNDWMAMAYLLRWEGPVDESSDPYPSVGTSTNQTPVRHVQQVRIVPGKSSDLDHDAIKRAVVEYGALFVDYHHEYDLFDDENDSYIYTGALAPNHAVALVGWDDTFPSNRFLQAAPGDGAYIVRNNWSALWGEAGYYYVSYYDSQFARQALSAFMNAEKTATYQRLYQYDPLGMVVCMGLGTESVWAANVFVAERSERLGAAGFYALVPDTSYTVSVYTGVSDGAPRSGTLSATVSGVCAMAGYYTVPFGKTVPLTAGQRFSIVVRVTTPGCVEQVACEYAEPGYADAAASAPGQSFYSLDGTSWGDFYDYESTANACIKAYVPEDQTSPTVSVNRAEGQAASTNGTPIRFAVTFSEAVTNFTAEDVVVSGTAPGSKTVAVSGEGAAYTVAVNGMTGDGTVAVSIPAGAATDRVGNPSLASAGEACSVTFSACTDQGTPYLWLDTYALAQSGDYAAAAVADTDGDGFPAWQEYVAGTVPTSATSFFTATLAWSNGQPHVSWSPDLGSARVYTVVGKAALSEADWLAPTNSSTRFFRVRVNTP